MRVLVTGGAGFIGSHVVDELVGLGHEVLDLDGLSPDAHAGPPNYLHPDAEHVVGDVRDSDVVASALRGADAVCHQAGRVGLGVDFADVTDYVSSNDVGMAVLLEAMWRASFRGRLVLASSMVVYGEGRYRCDVDGEVRPGPRTAADLDAGRFEPPCPRCGQPLQSEDIDEDAPLEPRNVYAATKVHQEHLAFAFARETGVPVTALRYHNVYGPRMPRNTPYAGVASLWRSALEAGSRPVVYEDGAQRRDFVHVRDVAHANVLALTADPPVGGAFNVASGSPVPIATVARGLAANAAGSASKAAREPVISGEYRLGDVRHVVASPRRAEELLGFRASVGLDAGMAEFATAPLREGVG